VRHVTIAGIAGYFEKKHMMEQDISKAAAILRDGGVVIFPTDTVWGIGAWIGSKAGIAKLYTLKKRDRNKPTALLVGSLEQAFKYGQFSAEAIILAERYWPGALTVVVEATADVPKALQNGRGGVGIRWPKLALVTDLCEQLPGGIAASSANEAGDRAPVEWGEVSKDLLAKSDFVIPAESALTGISSTVVDLMDGRPKIIRQGEVWLR